MTNEPAIQDPADDLDTRFFLLHTDGSGNGPLRDPEHGAIGIVVLDPDGNPVPGGEISEWIGPTTNTVAEYWALIEGLRLVLSRNIKRIDVKVDSRLLVEQLDGTSRVTKEYLLPFYRRACSLRDEFGNDNIRISWVERSQNSRADQLATEGLRKRPVLASGSDA